MDDKPEKQLTEKIKDCLVTVGRLLEEYESLLQKQMPTDTAGDSDHSVTTPLSNDAVTKRLKEIDRVLESNRQQLKLALEPYLSTQSTMTTSVTRPMIQSDNQMQVITHFQHVKQSDDDNGQNEAKLNPTAPEPQALFTGTLPDDVYTHLMSVMGIQECLIGNRLVCSLWNDLVLDRCHIQKSLKLFESFDCLWNYGEWLLKYEKNEDTSLILKSIGDDLLFEEIGIDHEELVKSLHQDDDESGIQKEVLTRKRKLDASKVLTTLFPQIEELVLIPEENTLINIEHLLQFYAKQLTSLTVTFYEEWYESLFSKLRAINFPKLKSLNTFNFSPKEAQLLSLLPQLESLTVGITEISLETLLRTGTQFRELNFGKIQWVYTAPEEEFSKRPPINSHLRKFTFVYSEHELQILEFISQNMTSLETLKLDFLFEPDNVYHLHLLSSHLVPLTQLHSLTLQARVSFFLLDDAQLAEIKPLHSVRQLRLLLWNFDSLPLGSMDLFSRSIFTVFPNAEQVLIGFVGYEDDDDEDDDEHYVHDGLAYADTLADFQDFALKHPNVVQLFRSKDMSRFTAFPNVVSPLLGHRRQMYEEYIEEEELFGMPLCKLAESLLLRQGEQKDANLKIALRAADRLSALSNLLQLLERDAFTFTGKRAHTMMRQMFNCATTYGPSQVALFIVTCKCLLFLQDCSVVDSDEKKPFLDEVNAYPFFLFMQNMVEHYMAQKFGDKSLLLQLVKSMVTLLKKFDSFRENYQLDEPKLFKRLLKLSDYYQTEQLTVLDSAEELLLQIHNLIDDQLKKFESEKCLDEVIRKLIRSKKRLYRVEMVRALTRCCQSTEGYFKLLSGEADSDSSEGDSSDSDSGDSTTSDSDSSDNDSSDGSSSSAESEPEL